MTSTNGSEMPTVILKLQDQLFGISAEYIREMVAMPKVVSVPNLPAHYRGVINLRGKVMPLIDLRVLLDKTSCVQETVELMELIDARENDHINWFNELEECTANQSEFTLATDAHKCKFGKWLDTYVPPNRTIGMIVDKFKDPHTRVHETAILAEEIITKGGHQEDAMEVIAKSKKENFTQMIQLFNEFRQGIVETHNEISVVMGSENKLLSIAVDSVESVELLLRENIEEIPEYIENLGSRLFISIARRNKDDSLVINMDPTLLFNETESLHFKSEVV